MSESIFVTTSESDVKFENRTFLEFVDERSFETKGNISFSNCIFKNPLVLENIIAREISFFDCHFEKQFYLGKSTFHFISFFGCNSQDIDIVSNTADFLSIRGLKGKHLELNGDYRELQIISSNVENVLINDVNSNYSHRESKVEFLVENQFKELKLKCSNIFSEIIFKGSSYDTVFFEGEFKKRIEFGKAVSISNLYFESSIFQSRIDFEDGDFEYVSFYRSSFHGIIYINDLSIVETKPRDIKIKSLTFHSSNFEKDVTVNISEIERFNTSNCNYKEVLNLNNYKNNKDNAELTMLSMDGINQGSIVIERLYADITLSGINFGNIFFKDIDISILYLNDYQNNGILSFSNIRTGNYFVIQNTTSGKMSFLNSDVNLFSEIVIADSNIDGANFYKYPNKILARSKNPIAGYGIKEKSLRILNLKNVYNQLKRIAKTKGDIDIASKFESLEHKQLLLSKRFGFDSILLLLNYLSNNNGNSWFRGVGFTLTTGLLFFILYLRTLNIQFCFDEDYKDYVIFISSFPKLELEKYSALNNEWKIQLVLWLSRIFISYGIYQTIAAFRKYGKG
jgi:hypothetical protein